MLIQCGCRCPVNVPHVPLRFVRPWRGGRHESNCFVLSNRASVSFLLLPVLTTRDARRYEDDSADETANHRQDDHVKSVDRCWRFVWKIVLGYWVNICEILENLPFPVSPLLTAPESAHAASSHPWLQLARPLQTRLSSMHVSSSQLKPNGSPTSLHLPVWH